MGALSTLTFTCGLIMAMLGYVIVQTLGSREVKRLGTLVSR